MSSSIPRLKRKISAFVMDENGRITKHSLLSLGAIIGGIAIGGALKAKFVFAQDTSAPATKHVHTHISTPPQPAHTNHSAY